MMKFEDVSSKNLFENLRKYDTLITYVKYSQRGKSNKKLIFDPFLIYYHLVLLFIFYGLSASLD